MLEFLKTYMSLLLRTSGLFLIIMFISGFLRGMVSPKVAGFTNRMMGKGVWGHVVALFGGMVTPFCSCGGVPVAISMLQSAVPVGVVITFLVAAPVIHEGTIIFMWTTMGKTVAILFTLIAAAIALGLGLVFSKFNLNSLLLPFAQRVEGPFANLQTLSAADKAKAALKMSVEFFVKFFPYLAITMVFGALLEDYVPVATVQQIVNTVGPFGVLLVTLIGVPIYARLEVLVPVGVVFMGMGLPIGTITAFLMASSVLSFPEMTLLSKVFKRPLLTAYIGSLTGTILAMGYGLNLAFAGHL